MGVMHMSVSQEYDSMMLEARFVERGKNVFAKTTQLFLNDTSLVAKGGCVSITW